MKNIVWKQSDNSIAVTTIFDDSDSQEYALLLKDRGDIASDWNAVAFDLDQFPTEAQESWRWDGSGIIVDAEVLRQLKYKKSITAFQIRAALNQLNLRDDVEQVVAAGNQDLKDAWAFAPLFNRFNDQVLAMQTALNLSDAEVDALFDLGGTL